MKLKKAGALGLSCVIALGSMAGCGSSKEKEKQTEKKKFRERYDMHSGIQLSNHTLKNA